MLNKNTDALLRILHVEDDEDMREITAMSLELTGSVTLMQSASGEDAIKHVVEFGPDVILLDFMMPGMSGPEVLSALKGISEVSEVPVIFMTARVQQDEIDDLISSGAISVIAKPFEPTELLGKIQTALADVSTYGSGGNPP